MDNYSPVDTYEDLAKVPGQVQDPHPKYQELPLTTREEYTIAVKDEDLFEERE